MKSLLIQDTTEEERRRIVEESLGFLGSCDDCMSGMADMYDDYIFGRKELAEIHMEFSQRYGGSVKEEVRR